MEEGVLKEVMDAALPVRMTVCRDVIADLYAMVVSGGEHCFPFLEQHSHLLDCDISIVHTVNCSCGRFFEQHPTSIDELEGERMTRILHQIQRGECQCLSAATEDTPVQISPKEARKTLLHAAAASGQTEVVRFLLSNGCDINKVTNIFSYTSLFLAICQNKHEVVSVLLGDKSISVNIRSRAELNSPLLEAMLTRKLHFVNQLLAMPDIDLDIRNFRQETPVLIAARMGQEQLLEQLLKCGASVDAKDHRGFTALMFAVNYGEKKVTKLLLSYGADINLRSGGGETPLLMAINNGNHAVVKILLDAGANVNDVSDDGFPALMLASYSNYTAIVTLLLEHGANIAIGNPQGYTAIHVSAWNGYINILSILLNAGALPDARTNDRNTPLSLAAHGNHERVVNMLIERGCNVNNADKDLDTPLHYAAFNGNLQCVVDLLDHEADPDALNRLNTTPLWNAVYRSHPEVVKVLLKKNVALNVATVGIEQHAQSDDVITVFDVPSSPLWVAAHQGSAEIALMLITAGCNVAGETWIGRRTFPGKSQHDEDLKNLLLFYHRNPRPLLTLCRNYLRQIAGRSVRRFVRRLEIPDVLRNYITLRDAFD